MGEKRDAEMIGATSSRMVSRPPVAVDNKRLQNSF